jgi:hypothetical protein
MFAHSSLLFCTRFAGAEHPGGMSVIDAEYGMFVQRAQSCGSTRHSRIRRLSWGTGRAHEG